MTDPARGRRAVDRQRTAGLDAADDRTGGRREVLLEPERLAEPSDGGERGRRRHPRGAAETAAQCNDQADDRVARQDEAVARDGSHAVGVMPSDHALP